MHAAFVGFTPRVACIEPKAVAVRYHGEIENPALSYCAVDGCV